MRAAVERHAKLTRRFLLKTNFDNAALVRTYRPCPRILTIRREARCLILKQGGRTKGFPKRHCTLRISSQIRRWAHRKGGQAPWFLPRSPGSIGGGLQARLNAANFCCRLNTHHVHRCITWSSSPNSKLWKFLHVECQPSHLRRWICRALEFTQPNLRFEGP